MQLKNREDDWLIDHPFGDIDGISRAIQFPERYETEVHLDIFVPDSLERMAKLLGVPSLNEAEGLIRRVLKARNTKEALLELRLQKEF